jgi:hypothetical protein
MFLVNYLSRGCWIICIFFHGCSLELRSDEFFFNSQSSEYYPLISLIRGDWYEFCKQSLHRDRPLHFIKSDYSVLLEKLNNRNKLLTENCQSFIQSKTGNKSSF